MNLNTIDILLFLILSQGIFLAIAIQLIPNRNRGANNMLSILLVIASVLLFGRIAIFQFNFKYLWRVATIIDIGIFLFGPFLYAYVRRLIFLEKKDYNLHIKHFALSFIYLVYVLWTFSLNIDDFNTSYFNGKLNIFFILTELLGLISIAFYTIKCFNLYKVFNRNQKQKISFHQTITKYVKILLIALSIFCALWFFSFVSFYVFGTYSRYLNYNTMWLSSSIFIYFIGFYSLRQPKIFRIPILNNLKPQTQKSRLSEKEISVIKNALEHEMDSNKIFLNPELSLNHLATEIGTTANNLSWYLNQVENLSFYKFINSYRIKEFLKNIKKGEHHNKTILSIALDSGFNSKATFNKSFKVLMNDTPNNYIKTHINKS